MAATAVSGRNSESAILTPAEYILIVVLELLTLFAIVGLSFASYADVRAVPMQSGDVAACDIVINVLDERGDVLDTVQSRVAPGEMLALRYRSRAEPGSTEPIRATISSRTVPRGPHPPASQEAVRQKIPAP